MPGAGKDAAMCRHRRLFFKGDKMATITRGSVIQKTQDLLGLQSGSDQIPNQSANIVSPVIEVGPKFSTIMKTNSASTSSNTTLIYTTPTDKDFYLTYACLSATKDAASDNTAVSLFVSVDNSSSRVLFQEMQTLTATSFTNIANFNYPLKLNRGSQILLGGTFTVGTMNKRATIAGFIVE